MTVRSALFSSLLGVIAVLAPIVASAQGGDSGPDILIVDVSPLTAPGFSGVGGLGLGAGRSDFQVGDVPGLSLVSTFDVPNGPPSFVGDLLPPGAGPGDAGAVVTFPPSLDGPGTPSFTVTPDTPGIAAVVPEPASLMLLVLGVTSGIAAARRRRN